MTATQEMERDHEVWSQTGEQDRLAMLQLQVRLQRQFGFSGPEIGCHCSEGILVLEGRVDSYYQKQTAQEIARRIPGVKSVVNLLVVDAALASSRVRETFCTTIAPVYH